MTHDPDDARSGAYVDFSVELLLMLCEHGTTLHRPDGTEATCIRGVPAGTTVTGLSIDPVDRRVVRLWLDLPAQPDPPLWTTTTDEQAVITFADVSTYDDAANGRRVVIAI